MCGIPFSERVKLGNLFDTFRTNFKVSQLYAAYLEHCPEAITKEMIDILTEDGRITASDAIAALISEMFGLDTDSKAEDRLIVREYIMPSIRILDTRRYTENPYYKNIKLPDVKDGSWEFRNEKYKAYRAVVCDDIIIRDDFREVAPLGFFTEDFEFPAVLEDGNEWMTLTPVDLDTCEDAISAATGKVVTFGLGLGYYAYMVSEKSTVESITVVERSEKVIELFNKYILPGFSHPEKVKIVCEDAFVYAEKIMPDESFDFAFVDTWRDASDGAPMYQKMKELEHLSPGTRFEYWIEKFLISRIRAVNAAELMRLYDSGKLDTGYAEAVKLITDTKRKI